MKRFHVHIQVKSIEKSIDFYSKLFGQEPTKRRTDYAKWMLENPRVNFAISSRGNNVGVNHFGFQVDTAEELVEIKNRAQIASNGEIMDQGETTCCYANSEKHWTLDPQGLAWEHFHTLSDAMEFGADNVEQSNESGACCIPIQSLNDSAVSTNTACCIPDDTQHTNSSCCN